MTDPSILAALTQALENDPRNVALRLHLAGLLLESGAEAPALEHFTQVLSQDPANLEGLRGAARAAQAIGDDARPIQYQALADAIGGAAAPADRRCSPPTLSTNSAS